MGSGQMERESGQMKRGSGQTERGSGQMEPESGQTQPGSGERKRRVLFLCTGNSARSQMAEAWVNARWGDRWEACSAGTRPAGYVHPMAVEVMQEVGISMEGARSKAVEDFLGQAFDLVVTVCDQAAEACPVWPGQARRVHLGFPDPAAVQGSDRAIRMAFRRVRDGLAERLEVLLGEVDRREGREAQGVLPRGG